MSAGVLLVAHGTVESLDELPAFLTKIRRGHAPSPELLAEVRRRYEAIGGRSPLNAINRELAEKLEARLGVPVRTANRLAAPLPEAALADLAARGVTKVVVVPLAQHSAPVYGAAVEEAANGVAGIQSVVCAPNWGRTPELTRAFASSIAAALAEVPPGLGEVTALVLTAHSLPKAAALAGDPYEDEVRASAEEVTAAVRKLTAMGERPPFVEHEVCFQSQGMSAGPGGRPVEWLGPDLRSTLEKLARRGRKHVVLAPIGFLADHVEILYDLDIEAKAWGDELGITIHRSASLNAGEGVLGALEAVARSLLGS